MIHSCGKITSALLADYLQFLENGRKSGVNEVKRKGNKFDRKCMVQVMQSSSIEISCGISKFVNVGESDSRPTTYA